MWLFSITLLPPDKSTAMDSLAIHNSSGEIYLNSPRYIVWNRDSLKRSTSKIILVGGSNLRKAIKMDIVRSKIRDIDVHNLSVGGMNITQAVHVIDLAYEMIPKPNFEKTTIVLALSYALFVHDKHRWQKIEGLKDSRVATEMIKIGLYQKVNGTLQPNIQPKYIPLLANFLRPFFTMAYAKSKLTKFIKRKLTLPRKHIDQNWSNLIIQNNAFKYWTEYMGSDNSTLNLEQFIKLKKLIASIRKKGSRVIIVDMPLPQWHMDRSAFFQEYQKIKDSYFGRKQPNLLESYINFYDQNDIKEFADSGHLNQNGALNFSRRLGQELGKIIQNYDD
jgi:hypothetical protein